MDPSDSPNARLRNALIDRIHSANIIETETESYRFSRTLDKRKRRTPDAEELIPRRRPL